MDVFGKEKEFGINYDTSCCGPDVYLFPGSERESGILLLDIGNATFKNCFINPAVYQYGFVQPLEFSKRKHVQADGKYDIESMMQEIKKINLFTVQSKYNFLMKHLHIGEFAEIYDVWHDHVNFDFDSPLLEHDMDLEDLPDLSKHKKAREVSDRRKLTIHKKKDGEMFAMDNMDLRASEPYIFPELRDLFLEYIKTPEYINSMPKYFKRDKGDSSDLIISPD
jgi:hypothetical protein